MDRIIRYTIARALKYSGFNTANQKALEFFIEVFTLYMFRTLGHMRELPHMHRDQR